MDQNNLKFKTISLNVRGIRTFDKRKSIFNWLIKQNSDICFLQETYSTEEIENRWRKQWLGDINTLLMVLPIAEESPFLLENLLILNWNQFDPIRKGGISF